MKKALLLLICSVAFAQIPAVQKTHGRLNGRFWTSISKDEKLHYVLGFADHWIHCCYQDGTPPWQGSDAFPAEIPFGDVITALDRFFEPVENLSISINDAIYVFTRKVHGESQDTIEVLVRAVRNWALKPEE